MKSYSRRLSVVFGLLLIAASASAQWKNVAPGLLGNDPEYGAMQYRDGIVWAGYRGLWSSTDSGGTWQRVTNFPTTDSITDISFYDRFTGLVSTYHDDGGVYLTTDGGMSWVKTISDIDFVKVSFNGSPQNMHALNFNGILYSSIDGGLTWNSSSVGSTTRSIAVANDRTIYIEDEFASYLGGVSSSNNMGSSFSASGQSIDGDCYTIAVDSCDPKRLYLVSEQINNQTDKIAKLQLSLDGGMTWQITASHALPYYSGAMTTAYSGVFVGTVSADGILRSMDGGMTWKSIGGPQTSPDTRNIAAVDNDIILAADPNGNIWLTRNSGGDSVIEYPTEVLSFAPKMLFGTDSLLPCDPPVIDTIIINASACKFPSVASEGISGLNSSDYSIKAGVTKPFSAFDTVIIAFSPSDTGARNGVYSATLSDGNVISVPLGGRGEHPVHQLSLATIDAKTDTVGGDIKVPIFIGGLFRTEDIDIVMHYDMRLQYQNSFDMSGAKLDITGEQWAGRSKLHIPNAMPGVQQGYALFNVWSDTAGLPIVTFDSLTVLSDPSLCEYILPGPDTSVITPLTGCGIEWLSRLVHLGEFPRFSVQPNPSSGDITISCDKDIGDVTIAVYDMLGAERGRESVTISKLSPARISLPDAAGVYYLRVFSQAGVESMNVVVAK